MKISTNRNSFEKQQTRIIQEIARDVKTRLEKVGIDANKELVGSFVFDICAIFDGSREMDVDGTLVRPYLTFVDDEEGEEVIEGGGSWMHEISHEIVAEIFENEPSA
jgi:hypothetical protein